MNKDLKEFAGELVSKLKTNSLTRGDLNLYFQYTNSNLKELYSANTVEDFKNITTPFLVMLSNGDFTENDYLWQTVCARAYYTSSYFIQTQILDSYDVPKPEKLIDYIELLKVRLMILVNGRSHFPELVFRVPKNPNKKNWSPLFDSGVADKKGFYDIVLSDAGLIVKYASIPILRPLQQENLAFANSVIRDNSNLLASSTIEEKISKGLILHRLFFNYLHNLLEANSKLDFHSDDD